MLVVLERNDEVAWKIAAQRAEPCTCIVADQLNTYDVLVSDDVVFTAGALEAFLAGPATGQERVAAVGRGRAEEAAQVSAIGGINKDPRDILLAPVVSEKSYGLLDEGKYTFVVDPRANKTEIKIAVEQVFGVKVDVGEHDQPQGQDAPDHVRHRQAQGHQARDRHAARTGTIDIFGGPVG